MSRGLRARQRVAGDRGKLVPPDPAAVDGSRRGTRRGRRGRRRRGASYASSRGDVDRAGGAHLPRACRPASWPRGATFERGPSCCGRAHSAGAPPRWAAERDQLARSAARADRPRAASSPSTALRLVTAALASADPSVTIFAPTPFRAGGTPAPRHAGTRRSCTTSERPRGGSPRGLWDRLSRRAPPAPALGSPRRGARPARRSRARRLDPSPSASPRPTAPTPMARGRRLRRPRRCAAWCGVARRRGDAGRRWRGGRSFPVIDRTLRRGRGLPGLDTPLTTDGDPRAATLLRPAATRLPARAGLRRWRPSHADRSARLPAAQRDLSLAAVTHVLDLPSRNRGALASPWRACEAGSRTRSRSTNAPRRSACDRSTPPAAVSACLSSTGGLGSRKARPPDGLLAPWSDRHEGDRRLDQRRQLVDVAPRRRRQLVEAARVSEIFLPPGHVLVDRLACAQPSCVAGGRSTRFAVDLVCDAHADGAHTGQHVELVSAIASSPEMRTAWRTTTASNTAAAARPSGGGAYSRRRRAALTQRAGQLGGERAAATRVV